MSACEIAGWRFNDHMPGTLAIYGRATCASGKLDLEVYNGEALLGSDFTFVSDHAFRTFVDVLWLPDDLSVRSGVKPR